MRAPLPLRFIVEATSRFFSDHASRFAASLSYYSLFAIAPVMLVAIAIAGMVFGEAAVRGELVGQIDDLLGPQGALAVQSLLEGAMRDERGALATILGSVTFVFACSGAFLELQAALNRVWRVTPRKHFDVRAFLLDRIQSLGLVVVVGFLLLVSLVVNTAIAAVQKWAGRAATDEVMWWTTVNLAASVVVVTALFSALFKVLPDVKLRWRDVVPGAVVTAILFTIGKQLIGLYLGHSGVASAYGAAGSVVVLLIWVHFTSLLVLWGAELTKVWTEHIEKRAPKPLPFAKHSSKAVDASAA
jgi:membrane protein